MATVQGRLLRLAGDSAGSLRLGCDPLHRHLLTAEASVLAAWHPIRRWHELLREGAIDAALVSVTGMATEEPVAVAEATNDSGPGRGSRLNRARGGDAIAHLPLGSRPLVLIHSPAQPCANDPATRPWRVLLPPAEHQPLLWRQLEQLALLPLRDFSADDSESWLQELLLGPRLLPAHLSLLEAEPWRDAGLRAVPPPEPLKESLWLLVRKGEERHARVQALAAQLQHGLLCGMQPES